MDYGETWVEKFLSRPTSNLFVRVDKEFLQNSFNITGIKLLVEHFSPAYELIRQNTTKTAPPDVDLATIEKEAEVVYGIIHARYLQTKVGLKQMYTKYYSYAFQTCPRVYCKKATCLPYGVSEELNKHSVQFFCPYCNDVYIADPMYKNVDGAYFGNSWVHIFYQTYLMGKTIPNPPRLYVPKIYGFKIIRLSDVEDDYEEEEASYNYDDEDDE